MKWYREFITQAPEEMNGFFAMLAIPPGPPFPQELKTSGRPRIEMGNNAIVAPVDWLIGRKRCGGAA